MLSAYLEPFASSCDLKNRFLVSLKATTTTTSEASRTDGADKTKDGEDKDEGKHSEGTILSDILRGSSKRSLAFDTEMNLPVI